MGFPVGTAGQPDKALDEIRFASALEEVLAPLTAEITQVTVTNAAALAFQSLGGVTYMLQFATDLAAQDWTDAGFEITGNGEVLLAHDPTGTSTQKSYRIVSGAP